jgi:hypothetical protein
MSISMNNFRNEAHIINFPAGHVLSCDCWCEPSEIKWEKDPHGNPVLVVYHMDDSKFHHRVILEERSINRDWITRYLNHIRLIPEKRGTND